MRKRGRFWCDGRHGYAPFEDEEPEEGDLVEAPFFRECASCGVEVNLCEDCRPRIFLCPRCFEDQRALGKDEARRRGRARERDRQRKRRERRRIYRAEQGQLQLWTVEEVFGG